MGKKAKSIHPRFVLCVKCDGDELLTPRRVYRVLPDPNAAKSDYLRVIDDEGEDYLYPADRFLICDFPRRVEQALLQTF
jgi:hypothetical protein